MWMVARLSRQQQSKFVLLKQSDLGTLRERTIGDHDQVHAPIARSQNRNPPGPGAPFAVVLRGAIPVAKPLPSPSAAPAADPDAPATAHHC